MTGTVAPRSADAGRPEPDKFLPWLVHVGERPLVTGAPVSTRRYQGPSALAFDPLAGHLAFVSGLGQAPAAWRVPVAGGEPEPFLEIEGASVSGLSWSSAGTLVASAQRGGTERWQLYARRRDGSVHDLSVSEGDSVQHLLSQGACSPDGRQIAFSANARDPEDVDVLIADLDSGQQRLLVSGPAWHTAGYWSQDSRLLQVMRVEQNTDQYLLLVNTESGQIAEITPHCGEEQNVPAGWLSDGRPLVITNHGREHLWLAAVDPATGKHEAIDARQDWGVELATSAADGSVQAWTVNQDGYSVLCWRQPSGQIHEVPGLDGIITDLVVSRDGTLAAYAYLPVTGAAELRLLHTASGETTVLLRDDAAADERFRPEAVRIPGPAGHIPAYLYRAAGPEPRPALLVIHGGPEGQSRPRLQPQLRQLFEAGITVLAPNIHGSTGYGKRWQGAIHRDWGGIDLADLRAVTQWMISQPDIDPARIGVYGGSYGGFAALTCITRMPQYWRCAVDLFGPCNLLTVLEDAEPNWRRWNRHWIGDPVADREKLWARSPLAHADSIRCPVLVMAGVNDPRVRKREADQLVERLRALDQEVEYLVFGGEGHGLRVPANMAAATARVEEFLRRHLLAPDDGRPPSPRPSGLQLPAGEEATARAIRPARAELECVGLRHKSDELIRELYVASGPIHDETTPDDEPRESLEQALAAARNVPRFYDGATIIARDETNAIIGYADVVTQDMDGYRHAAQVSVNVVPGHRRAGVGRLLFGAAVDAAEQLGRSLLMGNTRETTPAGEHFARRVGGELGQVITENRLDLRAVDVALVRSWVESGPVRAPGYRLEFVKGATPEHLISGVIAAFEILNSAPRDDLLVGDFTITPEQLKDEEAAAAAAGMERWAYYAVEDAGRDFVGLTDIVVNPGRPERIQVGNTGVAPAHRGHALGKWLKGAMTLKILDEIPAARWLVTSNAASNEAMLSINRQLGFRASAAVKTWQVTTERARQYLSGEA